MEIFRSLYIDAERNGRDFVVDNSKVFFSFPGDTEMSNSN